MASVPRKMMPRSSDGEQFEFEEPVEMVSQTIKQMIKDDCAANSNIPVPNVVASITLPKIVEYCRKQTEARSASVSRYNNDRLGQRGTEFAKVNSSDVKGPLDLKAQAIADMMKGKSPEQIRKIFNITSDFTPEEEEEVRKEYPWVFEKA